MGGVITISSSDVEGLELGPGGVDSVRFVSCDMVTGVSSCDMVVDSSCDKVVVASVIVLVLVCHVM